MNNETNDRALDWEDTIEKESEFILLPEGNHFFKVINFERARHPGSEKLPPCNKAVLSLQFETPDGPAVIKHNLFLHTKTEGMLSAFFKSIGQKQHGQRLQMNWNAVIGSTGMCKVGIRKWTGDDGAERESNEIKKFYDAAESPTLPPSATFTPGTF